MTHRHLEEPEAGEPVDTVEKADVAAGKAIASGRHHPVIDAVCQAGELGDQGPLYAMGGTLAAIGLIRKDPRCLIAGIAVVAAVGAADLMKNTLKSLVTRSRPHHTIGGGGYRFEPGGSDRKEEQSFPSGHTACTVAAVETAVLFYPAAAPHLRTAAVLMASTRIAKGKHWPLDILAGAGVGLIASQAVKCLIAKCFRRLSSGK